MPLRLHSAAFEDQQPIPKIHTSRDKNLSPPLQWEGAPPETKELAIICEAVDAPNQSPKIHWAVYNIPPEISELPAGLPTVPADPPLNQPKGALQGLNDFHKIGYGGPEPGPGPEGGSRRYRFKIYALDRPLEASPEAEAAVLARAMADRILEEAELIGIVED